MDAKSDSWDWNEESFTLDADSPLVISQSLWDEWAQSEADAHTLFTSTPPPFEVAELTMPTSFIGNKQVNLEVTDNQDPSEKDSPRCKRRRMLLFSGDQSGTDISPSDPIQQFEEATALNCCGDDLLNGFEEMQVPDSGSVALWFSEENFYYANEVSENWMLGYIHEGEILNIDSHDQLCVPVPACSDPEREVSLPSLQTTASATLPLCGVKPKLATPVAYPFAVVKPSGVEGDVTLKDINQRILMPPTRPIQHPVGDHAKPPSAASTGSGLSGKAVVALTKIHTEGKGTITIMRTKG